jgi:hypothetical protein
MLNYYLWLLGLTLAFSSSVIFFKLYIRSKGTPLGRVAFYVSINSFLWSIAIAVLLVPSMTMSGIYTDVFLLVSSLAGVASIVGAYYRATIQSLLTPSGDGKSRDLRVYYVLYGLAFAVAFLSVIRFDLGIPIWIEAMKGQSIFGEVGIIFLTGSLIMLLKSRPPRKLAYIGIALALIIGFIALIGNWRLIRFMFNLFHTGYTSDLTAVGLIAASLGGVLSVRRGLRTWTAQFIPFTVVLLIGVLALVGYTISLPTLYNGGVYVGLSIPTAICFLLIGSAQVWYAWNRS